VQKVPESAGIMKIGSVGAEIQILGLLIDLIDWSILGPIKMKILDCALNTLLNGVGIVEIGPVDCQKAKF
jgi:hypothetical protein